MLLFVNLRAWILPKKLQFINFGDNCTQLSPRLILQKITIEHLQDIIDFQATIILLTDGREIVYANSAFLDFLGFATLADFKRDHKCICEFFTDSDGFLPSEHGAWVKALRADRAANRESLALIRSHIFKVSLRSMPSDPSLFIASFEDVTNFINTKNLLEHTNRLLELKVQERTWELLESTEELEDKKATLEEAQRIAKLGSYIYTTSTRYLEASSEIFAIFGYDDGIEVKPLVLIRHLYKKDRKKLFDYLKNARAHAEIAGINIRIVDASKRQKTLRIYAKFFIDDFGKPYRIQGALQDITESIELKERAFLDHLTKIYNRRRISELIEEQLESGCCAGMIMFDIDHFKSINDTYGHPVGDSVLIEIAQVVLGSLENDAIFGRWGGEEFMVFLPNRSLDQVLVCANRLKNAVNSHDFSSVGRVTCSFGAILYKPNESMFEGIKRCDDALYLAKKHGRNCVVEG